MSLQGQARTAYKNYMDKVMTNTSRVEEPTSGGLMDRNRPVEEDTKTDYLLDQFKQLQKMRAGLRNG
tara:strand:+ start:1827 stop:2027 length:201 start_codon:yes stop_codon:yes gene_type:complete